MKKDATLDVLARLTEREKRVLEMRFGVPVEDVLARRRWDVFCSIWARIAEVLPLVVR